MATNAKFIKILGSKIHYIDQGKGSPVLFLHGVPTSSYIWRNVIPVLADTARCIAPDLIGMGSSGKPKIEYSFFDHVDYIEEFIKQLNLTNITLVLHGLGSAVGLDYAKRNEANIKAIAFYEPHLEHSLKSENLSLPLQEWLHPLKENQETAYKAVVNTGFMFDNFLPAFTLNPLDPTVFSEYKKPFTKAVDREPIWQYVQDFTVGKNYPKVMQRVAGYSNWLTKTGLPKLMMYSTPGLMTPISTVQWCKENLSDLVIADMEEGLHFEQESNPDLFGQILRDWYVGLIKN